MKISKQVKREAKQLFRSCLLGGVLDENRARQLVQAVVAQKPRGYMGILSHFHRLVRLDLERRAARVETPVPLPADLQGNVSTQLNRLYGAGLAIAFTQNPSLIG